MADTVTSGKVIPVGSAAETAPHRSLRVCVYRAGAHAAMDPTIRRTFGGAEIHAVLTARLLARRPDVRVRFVVDYVGQAVQQPVDGMEVEAPRRRLHDCRAAYEWLVSHCYNRFRSCAAVSARFPWLHVQRPSAGLLWQVPLLAWHKLLTSVPWPARRPARRPALTRDADVVCCFGATADAADVVLSCRRSGIPSVLFVMGDSELLCREPARFAELVDYSPHSARLMAYALAQADCVIVQTGRQQRLLAEAFGRRGIVLGNPVEIPSTPGPAAQRRFVLWIGRADLVHKRSDLLLQTCRACPAVPFRAIVNRWQAGVFEEACRQAPPNLQIIDRASPAEVAQLLRQSVLLVNTSASEGFPNAFLQAAAEAVPVISLTVDPDGFCAEHGCGIACGGQFEPFAEHIDRLWHDRAACLEIGRRGRAYVLRHHDGQAQCDALLGVLRAACGRTHEAPAVGAAPGGGP